MCRDLEPQPRSTSARDRVTLLVMWETPGAGATPGHRSPRGEHLQRMPCALSRDYRRGGTTPGLGEREVDLAGLGAQRHRVLPDHPLIRRPPAREIRALWGEQLEGAILLGQVLIDGRPSGAFLDEM